jgi:hypothetical protein
MNDKTRRVFAGWLKLTEGERRDLENAVREYNTATLSEQRRLMESTRDSVTKMETGPLPGGCPCCGR